MSWQLAILILMAVLFAIAVEILRWFRLRPLLRRPCAGIRWHRRFPTVPHEDTREFLLLFTGAFGFRAKHRRVFGPDDRVIDIYNAINPPHISVDACELEALALALENRYGVSLEKAWREDITLGELFELSRSV